MASEGRIVLNIGGSRFEVPVTTLARHPESLLGSLVTGGESSEFKMEANGEYFFDRNGRFFEFILEFYRSGVIAPPTDMPSQSVIAELNFWKLPVQMYLDQVEGETKIRNYVEAPAEVPLDKLDSEELLERLAEMSPPDRLQADIQFVRHEDTDLIQVAVADLTALLSSMQENAGGLLHNEVLWFLAFGEYRLGRISRAKQAVAQLLKQDPENKQGKDLQILLQDTSTNYTKLGLLAIGVALFGAAALKVWSWTSTSSSSHAPTTVASPIPLKSSGRK